MKKSHSLSQQITQAHQLYCRLTSQNLSLRFDRERLWYELLRYGFSLTDIKTVITYLQNEINHRRRNIGALKLSNLLQPDKFEEDLHISQASLAPPPHPQTKTPAQNPIDSHQRRLAIAKLSTLRQNIKNAPQPMTNPRQKCYDTFGHKSL